MEERLTKNGAAIRRQAGVGGLEVALDGRLLPAAATAHAQAAVRRDGHGYRPIPRSARQLPQAILLDPSDNGLVLARRLHRRGVRVSTLTVPAYSWVARSGRVERSVMDGPLEDPGAWLERLRTLARDGEGVLIPGSDAACELIARERSEIAPHLRSFESAASAHLKLMDKEWLYDLAARTGARFPHAQSLSADSELDDVLDETRYPCLLKPALSYRWRRLFGEPRVILARNAEELRRAAQGPLKAGLKLLVTEYIPGPEGNLEAAVTLRRPDGSLALSYGRRKLRGYPLQFGAGSLQESAEVPETVALAQRVLDASDFVGVSSVEAKRHAATGEMVIIEVNVRIPQSFALGDASGTDASWRLYATLAGLALPPQPAQVAGVRSVVPTLELRALSRLLRQRNLSLRSLVGSYRRVRDVSGLGPREPRPSLAFGALQLRDAARLGRSRWRAGSGRTGP